MGQLNAISKTGNMHLYTSTVLPTATNARETWTKPLVHAGPLLASWYVIMLAHCWPLVHVSPLLLIRTDLLLTGQNYVTHFMRNVKNTEILKALDTGFLLCSDNALGAFVTQVRGQTRVPEEEISTC